MILNPKDRIQLGNSSGTVIASDEITTSVRWDTDPDSIPERFYVTERLVGSLYFSLISTRYSIPILPIDPEAEKEVDKLIASKSRPIRSVKKEREDIIAYLRNNGVRDYIIDGIERGYHLKDFSSLGPNSTYQSIQNMLNIWIHNNIILESHKDVINIQLKKIFAEVPNLPIPQMGVTDEQNMVGFTWDTKYHTNIEIFKDGYLEFFQEELASGYVWGEEMTLEEGLSPSIINRLKEISI